MNRRESTMVNRPSVIALIVVFALITGLFAFMFFNCINLYSEFDVTYSNLECRDLTFEKYEKIDKGKYGPIYKMYFKEYDEPLRFNRITNKKLDKTVLGNLKEGESVRVYFRESSNRHYDYEICEMRGNNGMVLELSDYVEANQNNQIAGMILCPLLMLDGVFLIWVFSRMLKPMKV